MKILTSFTSQVVGILKHVYILLLFLMLLKKKLFLLLLLLIKCLLLLLLTYEYFRSKQVSKLF